MGEEEEKTRAKREKLDIFVMEFCTFFLLSVRSAEGRTAQMLNNLSDYLCFHVFHYFGEALTRFLGRRRWLKIYSRIHFGGNSNSQCSTLKYSFFLFRFFSFFREKSFFSQFSFNQQKFARKTFIDSRPIFAAFRSAEFSIFFRFSLYPPRKNYGRSILLRFHRFRNASFPTAKSTQLTINPHGSALTLFH